MRFLLSMPDLLLDIGMEELRRGFLLCVSLAPSPTAQGLGCSRDTGGVGNCSKGFPKGGWTRLDLAAVWVGFG